MAVLQGQRNPKVAWFRCVVSRGSRGAADHKKAINGTPDGKMPGESRSSLREIQGLAMRDRGLSTHAYGGMLRVARTAADLAALGGKMNQAMV